MGTMTQHTPGPWHLIEGSASLRIHPDFEGRPGGVVLTIGSRALSFVPPRSGSHRGERMHYRDFSEVDRANAHLIAAAPELLEALTNLLGYADAAGLDDESMSAARTAIAKATGG